MKARAITQCITVILAAWISQSTQAQLVTRARDNATFSTIQSAINDAGTVNGDVLNVAAGNYYENVLVNKEVIILGPNAGTNGNSGSRVAEAIIMPPEKDYGDLTYNGGYLMRVTADNVTIDGLTLDGDNPNIAGEYSTNFGWFDLDFGILSYWNPWYEYPYTSPEGYDPSGDLAGDNLKIRNNVLRNFKLHGVFLESDYFNPIPKTGEVVNNKIENAANTGIYLMQNYYANIDNNTITNSQTGIQIYFYWLAKPNNSTGTIKYNNIESNIIETNWGDIYTGIKGINTILIYNNIPQSWEVTENNLDNFSVRSAGSTGIISYINWTPTALLITNNNVTGYESGYDIRSSGDGGEGLTPAPTQTLTISGGVISNCKFGVWATNLSTYYGTAQSAMYMFDKVLFTNNTDAGIFIDDQSPLNANLSTVSATANNCKISGSPVAIKVNGLYAHAIAHNNDLSGNSSFAIQNLSPNIVDATCNWYGHWTGPNAATNTAGQGANVSVNVTYDPWLVNGSDADPSLAGFQPVPGSCVPIRCGNNNKKYFICHNNMTKCVGYDDAIIHIAHGDPLGACPPSSISSLNMPVQESEPIEKLLVKCFPNPFTSATTLEYQLPVDGKVTIRIFDPVGKAVLELIPGLRKAGLYKSELDASRLSKGIYYYKLTVISDNKELSQTGKLIKQ